MVRTIALEEHFTTKELAAYAAGISSVAQPEVWAEALRLLLDVTAERLSAFEGKRIRHQNDQSPLRVRASSSAIDGCRSTSAMLC